MRPGWKPKLPLVLVACWLPVVLGTALTPSACNATSSALPEDAAPNDAGDGASGIAWHWVAEDLSGALFSVTGSGERDVWAVGSDRGRARGPTIVHWDGSEWSFHDSGLAAGDLLWAHRFEGGELWLAGSDGTILHKSDASFERMNTPSDGTVWGLWGASPDEAWAVGTRPGEGGFVWRRTDTEWQELVLDASLPAPDAWFKVWGTAADDVWFCGSNGAMMHFDGADFAGVDSGTDQPLLTIHGRRDGSLVTAVGGLGTARIVASEGGNAFRDVTPENEVPPQLFGVFHREDRAYAVGLNAFVLRQRGVGSWQIEETGLPLSQGFHGVWLDPAGAVWAVGGQIVAPPFSGGVLLYRGTHPPRALEESP